MEMQATSPWGMLSQSEVKIDKKAYSPIEAPEPEESRIRHPKVKIDNLVAFMTVVTAYLRWLGRGARTLTFAAVANLIRRGDDHQLHAISKPENLKGW